MAEKKNRLAVAQTYLGEVGDRYKQQGGQLPPIAWLTFGLGHAIALTLLDIAETLRDIKTIFKEGQNG